MLSISIWISIDELFDNDLNTGIGMALISGEYMQETKPKVRFAQSVFELKKWPLFEMGIDFSSASRITCHFRQVAERS